MIYKNRNCVAAISIIAIANYASAAYCDTVVISSILKNYSVGQTIQEDSAIHLLANEQFRVMDTKTGETRLLVGPYDGNLSSYKLPCSGTFSCDKAAAPKHVGGTRKLK